MSATEWKPGDVAMLTNSGVDHLALRTIYGWVVPAASGYRDTNQGFDAARRLVVLDPESDDDVQRLMSLYVTRAAEHGALIPALVTQANKREAAMRAALRELANPTPPKPDEPTGLGAVVEDGDGGKWVRTPSGAWHGPGKNFAAKWDYLPDGAIVRVLSEGVSE